MTNWIFYPRLPPASRHKTGKTEKSWANAWINSHECHRRSKYCINISAELHMLDVERCLLLPYDAIRPPDESHTYRIRWRLKRTSSWRSFHNPFTMNREVWSSLPSMGFHRSDWAVSSTQLQEILRLPPRQPTLDTCYRSFDKQF